MRRQRPWRLRTVSLISTTAKRAARAARAGGARRLRPGRLPRGAALAGACAARLPAAARRGGVRLLADGRARSTSRPLLHALHARGHPVVLPVTPPRGQPLTFRRWRPGDALVRERFGTLRPAGEARGAGLPAGAAAGVRPAPAPAGLRRRLLRPHAGGAAAGRFALGCGLRRAGDGCGAGRAARRARSTPSPPSTASSAARSR